MRKLLLFLLAGIFIPVLSPVRSDAQIHNQELYPAGTRNEKDPRQRVERLIRTSRELFKNSHADSAIQCMLEAIRLSSKTGYRRGLDTALSGFMKYSVQWEIDHLSTPHAEIFQQILTYLKPHKGYDRQTAWLHDGLGSYYFAKGSYAQGLLEYEKALSIIQQDTGKTISDLKTRIYTDLSGAWTILGEEREALEAWDKAHKIAVQQNDIHRQITLLQHKGILYFSSRELDSAYRYFDSSYALSLARPDQHPEGCRCRQYTIANLCQVLLQQHKPDQALPMIDSTILLLEQDRQERIRKGYRQSRLNKLSAFFYYLKGYAAYEKKDYKGAEQVLLPLLRLVQEEQIEGNEANIHEVLAAVYEATGQYKKAYQHKDAYAGLSASRSINREKSKLLSLHYTIEKDKEMAGVQLMIQQQRNEIREKNFWIVTTLLGVLLLGISTLAIYRNSRNKQRLQQAYIRNLVQEQEIDKLQAKVEGEQQERVRIAQELHDGIVSQLLGIKLHVNALQVRDGQTIYPCELKDVAAQLEEATQDLRHTAHNLMPDLLLRQGLIPSVAMLCEQINRNTELDADLQAYGQLPALTPDTELALYRILQELIQNVLKHAEATQLLIQLSCRDALLCVTVEDDGKGIPPAVLMRKEGGTGLANLQRRVNQLQGQLDIRSGEGRTTIYLEFDLDLLA